MSKIFAAHGMQPWQPPALLDLRQTAGFIGFSYSAVRQWTYGQKPAPAGWPGAVRVSAKATRYRLTDLQRWVEGLGEQQKEVTSGPAPRRPGRPAKLSARGVSK
jgi:hypothetical protein